MWMMGYNDGCHDDLNSFNGRKLLPLLPKPVSSTTTTAAATTTPQFFPHYNHQLAVAEQNKLRELNTSQVVVSSRWNPTPEQLRALEELYRRGTRTPSADQIQNITAQLRRYGKIEGKNVFYWFQNHKARERQKRRRQMEAIPEEDQQQILSEKKELLGTSRTIYEGHDHKTKNWVPSTNYSSGLTTEEYYGVSSTHENIAKAGAESSTTEDELIQLRPEILHNRSSSFDNVGRNSTWQTMHLSYPPISTYNNTHHNLINTLPSSITATTIRSTTPVRRTIMDQNHHQQRPIKTNEFMNYFITPSTAQNGNFNTTNEDEGDQYLYGGDQSDQTLELFPLQCGTLNEKDCDEILSVSAAMSGSCISSTTSQEFFEFLPLKN